MRSGKGMSRSKHDAGMRNGATDVDKGFAAPARRGERSSSDSDDANVMRQLLTPYVSLEVRHFCIPNLR